MAVTNYNGKEKTSLSNTREFWKYILGGGAQAIRKAMGLGDTLGPLPVENGGTGSNNGTPTVNYWYAENKATQKVTQSKVIKAGSFFILHVIANGGNFMTGVGNKSDAVVFFSNKLYTSSSGGSYNFVWTAYGYAQSDVTIINMGNGHSSVSEGSIGGYGSYVDVGIVYFTNFALGS